MRTVKDRQKRHLGGNSDKDSTYYPKLYDYCILNYDIKTMIDIGCGRGRTARYFYDKGIIVTAVDGLEYNTSQMNDIQVTKIVHDFSIGGLEIKNHFDFGWCCEVLEHIDEKYVDNILILFRNCKRIGITHALPGQRGYHHVNCKPPEYWIDKIRKIDFTFNEKETSITKSLSHGFYQKTGMIFDNNSRE
jgi:SAM-dependent methyltransferase